MEHLTVRGALVLHQVLIHHTFVEFKCHLTPDTIADSACTNSRPTTYIIAVSACINCLHQTQ